MKFKVLGSGGCTSIPRATCSCRVCKEAREKGTPYSRFGCSLFIEDINLLIDTPEDINIALNKFDVKRIDNVLYSHWHPDHTLGMRVFEQIKINWCELSVGIKNKKPINVFGLDYVIEDIRSIKNKFGPYVENYEKNYNLIKVNVVDRELNINDIKITFIPVSNNISSVFVFEQKDKKVIYAPCNVKPFPDDDLFNNANLLIIGNTITSEVAKDNFIVDKDNEMRKHMFVMDEIVELKKQYNVNKVIITHLDEDWGLSYDDYLKKAKNYDNIEFAYDGLNIEI